MKKLLTLLLITVLILCSCTPTGKPENTSDRMYGLGMAALEIVDDYLDGKRNLEVTYDDFQIKADEISQHQVVSTYTNDSNILREAVLLSYELFNTKSTIRYQDAPEELKATDLDVLEQRNRLAESLGEKAR